MSESYLIENKIIYVKVEDAYAVWFQASGTFLMIEEPAFYVLELLLKNVPHNEIVQQFSEHYKNPVQEVHKFVLELTATVEQYLRSKENNIQKEESELNQDLSSHFYSEKTYSLGNIVLKINYGDKGLEEVIHPLIAHFEVSKKNPFHFFEIFRSNENLIFKANEECIENLKSDETGFLKAAVLLKLLEILYNIKNEDWMMTIHASAITDGKSALVFPAMAGSGKSTLATLLHANGFQLLSDDFIALDLVSKSIFELPVAATIKAGSVDVLSPYFPELNKIISERAYTGKQVRYLPVKTTLNFKEGFLAKNYVFISYSENSAFTFKEVSKKIAMQRLLEQTWINPVPSTITEFFNWFHKTKFYEMEYSDFSDALKVVQQLFNRK